MHSANKKNNSMNTARFPSVLFSSKFPSKLLPSKTLGFTLIELMITVAIVAILAGIAIPSYNNYILKAHRKEAVTQIYSLSERLERARSSLLSYDSFRGWQSTQFTRYQYSINVTTPSTYTITATPLNGQVNDSCGALIFDSSNVWSFGNANATESSCL